MQGGHRARGTNLQSKGPWLSARAFSGAKCLSLRLEAERIGGRSGLGKAADVATVSLIAINAYQTRGICSTFPSKRARDKIG